MTTQYGAKQIFRLPFIHLTRIGSWDSPRYSKFGIWGHDKRLGFSLRFRAYVLVVGR